MQKPPQERYRPKPYLGSSHTWALEQVAEIPTSASVLDVGAGSGVIGAAMKSRGFLRLTAVEIDHEARGYIQDIYSEVHSEIKTLGDRSFDIIFLLDILEHLASPETFFRDLLKHLSPKGVILVSVPNITHWSIRLSLLLGFFEYRDRGLLDRTHLQFFTRGRLLKLAGLSPDLYVADEGSSIEPLEFLLPEALWDNSIFKLLSKFRLAAARMLPGLMAYQHLAVFKRRA